MKKEKTDLAFLLGITMVGFALLFMNNCASKPAKDTPSVTISKPSPTVAPTETPAVVDEHKFIDPAAGVKYAAAWDGKVPDTWTPMLVKILTDHGQLLLKKDIKDAAKYCPKFNSLNYKDRMQVYVALFSKMSQYESNFKPETKFTEGFKDSKGKYVISRGLLQLSVESANQSAYGCGATTTNLHDVKFGLTCGVKIGAHWIVKDGYMGSTLSSGQKGIARYWSVGRSSSGSNAKIAAYLKSLKVCQ